ncbi:MAG: glycosyltransferase family 4 protein [bacterium]
MKRPQKVLMLLARDPVFEQRVFQLSARTLRDAGFEVTIVGPRYRDEPVEQVVEGIRIITYQKMKNTILRKFHTLAVLWKHSLRHPADILHVFEVDAPLFVAAMAKRRLRKRGKEIKLVFDSPEVWSYFYPAQTRFRFLRKCIRNTVVNYEDWMVQKHVDAISTAHVLEESYYQWLNPWLPIRWVVGGPPMNEWPDPPERKGPIRILGHDGYFTLQRGMDVMLHAFELLSGEFPKLRLLAAGSFMEERDREYFEKWCIRTGLGDRVEVMGWVPRDEVLPHLDRMDIGMIANRPDIHSVRCWPANKMMNYLARGLPVVSTPAPLYRRFIEETGCGAVSAGFDGDSYAAALRSLLKNSRSTREMGRRGYDKAAETYNLEQGRKALLALYGDLDRQLPKRDQDAVLRD